MLSEQEIPITSRRKFLKMAGTGVLAGISGCTGNQLVDSTGADTPAGNSKRGQDTWPMFQYDPANSGSVGDISGPSGELELVWEKNIEALPSAPVIHDQIVYTGSYDHHVYALDARTGTEVWKFETDGRVYADCALTAGSLIAAGDSTVYSLDLVTGEQEWALEVGSVYTTSINAVDGTVYVPTSANELYAIDGHSGQQKWTSQWHPASPVVGDGMVFGSSGEKGREIVALHADTGEEAWTARGKMRLEAPAPALANETLIVSSGRRFEDDGRVVTFDASTGDEMWSYTDFNSARQSAAVTDGTIHIDDHDGYSGYFHSIDLESGTRNWVREVDMATTAPVVVGETLFVGGIASSGSSSFYAVDITSPDDRRVYPLEEKAIASPAVSGETAYFVDDGGNVLALGGTQASQN